MCVPITFTTSKLAATLPSYSWIQKIKIKIAFSFNKIRFSSQEE
jgi:hypothetical protein